MSCNGNGYLSGNTLVSFPFEDGQSIPWIVEGSGSDSSSAPFYPHEDVVAGAQSALDRCFADACVNLDAEPEAYAHWPAAACFSVSGDVLSFRLSALGDCVDVSARSSREKFPIVSGKAPWGSYTFVLSSDGIRGFREYCESNHVMPPAQDSSSSPGPEDISAMRLCARCVTVRPASLRTIKASSRSADGAESHFTATGDVSFRPGNNMEFSDPGEGVNGLRLNAVAGAGAGKVPCECGDAPSGGSLVFSPDGHTRIFNDTCYDLEPGPIGTRVVNGRTVPSRKLLVYAKCTACCTCGMYEAMVLRLAGLAGSLRGAKSDVKAMLEKYEGAVKKFNARVSVPELGDMSLALTGMPTSGNLGSNLAESEVSGSMNRCAFSATMRNSSFVAVDATVVEMSSGSDAVMEATASWSSEDGSPLTKNSDSAAGIIGTVFRIYPGRSLSLVFVAAKAAKVHVAGNVTYTGSVSLSLAYSGGTLGVVSKSVEVSNGVQQ